MRKTSSRLRRKLPPLRLPPAEPLPEGSPRRGPIYFAEPPLLLGEIAERVRATWAWLCELPITSLAPKERIRIGSLVQRDAPLLVHAVARALEENADLAADAEVSAEALIAAQTHAQVLGGLRDQLLAMAQLAGDGQMQMQAQAAADAMRALAVLEGPRRDLDEERRTRWTLALGPARTILLARRRRADKGLKKWLKQKRAAASYGA